MPEKLCRISLLMVLALLASACAPAASLPPPTQSPAAASPTRPGGGVASPRPVVTPTSPQPDSRRDELVRRARMDAAARAGVPVDRVQVVTVEAREWSDASVGCPEPGMVYAQVITPGYLIVLEAGGRRFEYHTDRGSKMVLCEGGRPA